MATGTTTATLFCDIYDKVKGELVFTDRNITTHVECTETGEILDFTYKVGEIKQMNSYLYAVCLDDMWTDKEVEEYDNGSNKYEDFILLVKHEEADMSDWECEWPDEDDDAYDRMRDMEG